MAAQCILNWLINSWGWMASANSLRASSLLSSDADNNTSELASKSPNTCKMCQQGSASKFAEKSVFTALRREYRLPLRYPTVGIALVRRRTECFVSTAQL